MSDPIDLGNEKAEQIRAGQLLSQTGITHRYVIAHCSGDGELVTKAFTGTMNQRFAFMEEQGINPDMTNNWAFGQWSVKELLWVVAGGDGEMKAKMRQHFTDLRQRSR